MPTWSVYIVRCRDGSLYTGISTDVDARLKRHNDGKGAAYTRSHRPVELVWQEIQVSESAARKREAEIKSWTRQGNNSSSRRLRVSPYFKKLFSVIESPYYVR